jgi:hypothetical protein
VGNGFVYGYTGPPFNFLGHFCTTQQQAFNAWVNARTSNFTAIQLHYQIRAQQLRKTAGVLEQFYAKVNDDTLKPTFMKPVWQVGPHGHLPYAWRDDHLPMVAMSKIKNYMREQFNRQDESVFHMNQLRNLIEKQEDKAQSAYYALNHPTNSVAALITKINGYFARPEYQAALVMDQSDVYPSGSTQPRFRVSQLDPPTQYELEQAARTTPGGPINLQEPTQT